MSAGRQCHSISRVRVKPYSSLKGCTRRAGLDTLSLRPLIISSTHFVCCRGRPPPGSPPRRPSPWAMPRATVAAATTRAGAEAQEGFTRTRRECRPTLRWQTADRAPSLGARARFPLTPTSRVLSTSTSKRLPLPLSDAEERLRRRCFAAKKEREPFWWSWGRRGPPSWTTSQHPTSWGEDHRSDRAPAANPGDLQLGSEGPRCFDHSLGFAHSGRWQSHHARTALPARVNTSSRRR